MPSATLAPPLGGWNTLDGVVGMGAEFAPVLDNLIPEQGRLRVRPGYRVWASGLPGRVDGLLAYRSGTAARLFAASGTAIYDVTAAGPVGSPAVLGLASARWDGIMVGAAGGNFLLAFNGTDGPRTFDGAAWAAWTGTGVPVAPGWANVFKGQLYVGRADRLSFWYLAPGAIGGAATEFPLQGVARRGGGVAGMATWTLDGGNGPDDYAAFLTTEGEVLVYKGTNPSSASTWGLVGTYSMPRPVGSRFIRPFGGDVLILTEGGVFALSALVSGADAGTLAARAYTRRIEPTFLDLARGRREQSGWDLVPLPALGLWLVNVPWGAADAQQLAFRAATGAASRLIGLAAACWLETGGRAYFGAAASGRVLLWGEDAGDGGTMVMAEAVQAFSGFGADGRVKHFKLLQPILADAAGAGVRVEVALDWRMPRPDAEGRGAGAQPVEAVAGRSVGMWGRSRWGRARWGGGLGDVVRVWRGVRGIGQAGAVRLRLTSLRSRPGWLGTGVAWDRGGALR